MAFERPDDSDLRIRLEGQLEHIEALITRWEIAARILRASTWQDIAMWPEGAESEIDVQQVLERFPEEATRYSRRLAEAQHSANTLALKRMKKLKLPVLDPNHAVKELKQHLPLQFESSKVSQLISSARQRQIIFSVLISMAVVLAVRVRLLVWPLFLISAYGRWRYRVQSSGSLVLTQRVVVADGISIPWEKIASVEVVEWRTPKGTRLNTTGFTFNRTDGPSVTLQCLGEPEAIVSHIVARGLATPRRRKIEENSTWPRLRL